MFFRLINKILSLIVLLRYRNVPSEVRYYYRDTYYCQLVQLKYFFRDYVFKKPYKEICFSGEFAPDILYVLPFAYWHYKNGTLKSTTSAVYTDQLYFFSPEHHEVYKERTLAGNMNYETPRILYSHNYNMRKWTSVPLKEMYKNNIYVYNKPILIIANRYNSEWSGPPISFFSIELLDYMIKKLKQSYTIVYNRPAPKNISIDNSDIYDLHEFAWLAQEHPDVILMEDLWKENKGKAENFNHLQLMVYANADHFISTHGGTGTLASYFKGINLLYSKKGLEHHFGCFHILFPKLSGTKMLHSKNDEETKKFIEQYFVRN